MDIHSEEKAEKDRIRAEAVVKYTNHFKPYQTKQSVICGITALLGIAAATKWITPHAGFRLSIGAGSYMLAQALLERVEERRIKKEEETGNQTFQRLQLTKNELDFLRGQLGPKNKFLKVGTYVEVNENSQQ